MAQSHVDVAIKYPESDGEPMGETQLHIDWLIRLLQILQHRYRGQKVFVAGDLIVYYVEGQPLRSVCPDVFVVKDLEPLPLRRTFLTWEEGRVPEVVFELTSLSTRRRDEIVKPHIYAEIGVREYFLYDPTADYLDPPLQGHRLVGGQYQRIEPDENGRLLCAELGILLQLDGTELDLFDHAGGERLLTEAEAAAATARAAAAKVKAAAAKVKAASAEAKAAKAKAKSASAEAKVANAARLAAEAEVERLRKLLEDQSRENPDGTHD
jgi:Uma2 family endonuclease